MDFVTVYIKEAHPSDGWQKPANETEGVCYTQPKTIEDRRAIAKDFVERFHWAVPLVVDPMDNPAEVAYSGWPERLYVVGADGRIAYKGAMGPDGFDPEAMNLLLNAITPGPPPPGG